jgi:hypothetical protein
MTTSTISTPQPPACRYHEGGYECGHPSAHGCDGRDGARYGCRHYTAFINLTPHLVHLVNGDNKLVAEFPADEAGPARLKAETVPFPGTIFSRTVYGQPTGLPEPTPGIWLIVSQIVFSALPERKDLCVPAEVVRDATGAIIGCRSFGIRA